MVFELLALIKGSVETLITDGNQETMTNITDDHSKTLAIMLRGAVRLSCLIFSSPLPLRSGMVVRLGIRLSRFLSTAPSASTMRTTASRR